MVDAIVSSLLEQLSSVATDELKQQVRLVTGVRQEVKKLTSNLQAIQLVLEDAEKRQMQHDKAVTFWLDQLKDASYDMEDVLEEWATSRLKLQIEGVDDDNALALAPYKKKVRSFFCAVSNCFGSFKQLCLRHDIAVKIRGINEKLDDIASQKDRFKFVENVSNNVKKPERVRTTSLMDEGETLSREIRVAKAIIEGLGESTSSLSEFQSLMSHIHRSIEGKKFFLVLDDVWDGDYNKWEPFFICLKNGHHRSKILVTTRNESVALRMRSTNIISIKQLAEEECWSLFEQLAFFGRSFEDREKLEPMGRKIAHKCKGLPLAAKVIGNLLRSKSTVKEWQRILESEMWKVEEIGQGLLAPLLLSYNDLPSNSMVKRCFSYCVVFPKDYNMNKRQLINLWMAQGYLNADEEEEMEMIGEEYFNILAARSFFQEFQKDDDDDDIVSCKMHDIVHDFAQFVSSKECLWLEINGTKESVIHSFGDKVRHLGLNFEGGASFPMSFFEFDRLPSLLIYDKSLSNPSLNGSILSELFSKLACLRALVISQFFLPLDDENFIREIPENVGKLIHLKYLNLSELGIEILPETLCELYNLHKLDIRECRYLRELPAGIGKLKNMRSLLNDKTYSLKYMPIGISRLTSLRTLEKFVVGGGVDGGGTCRLESLKNLQLRGKCSIEGLSNVSHVDEAERLQLYNKKNLLRLRLQFGGVVDGEGEEGRRKNIEKDKQLLEALQPPLNVEELWIISYRGNIFPKWLTLLTNLRNLTLSACVNCEHLPPLGKLPLEKLELEYLISVKRVGNEFLGIEGSSEDDPSSSSSSSSVIVFPKLKSLHVGATEELEEWNYRITRKENISIMPRLSSLTIWYCPKLKVLPDYLLRTTALQELRIWGCPILENRYREGKGEDWHKISHIPHIKWRDSRKCQNYTSNSQVQSNLVLMMHAGEQDYENEKCSQRIAKMFCWLTLKTLMENIGVTKDYHCGYCATFGCWTLKKEVMAGLISYSWRTLGSPRIRLAMELLPLLLLCKAATIGCTVSWELENRKERLSVTIPSVSTFALGYGAFLGPYANMRYQLLYEFDRAVINHFDVIGVVLFLSTALRSRLAWLGVEADPLLQSDDLLKKAYNRPSQDVNGSTQKSPRWLISKNAIVRKKVTA
ncbi:hypothetical protein KPL70_014098 [Citrus sinensis]|nr:hypothetical protein KPL70_014098 [Citrus sinensis]